MACLSDPRTAIPFFEAGYETKETDTALETIIYEVRIF
jgi:hypothetical protein